jgi:hypothetical protein
VSNIQWTEFIFIFGLACLSSLIVGLACRSLLISAFLGNFAHFLSIAFELHADPEIPESRLLVLTS